ncbi:MAG TPA: hypothetical protein VJ417_15325, partial [Candidatus Glassbacteria bacterium]|nr:hypothetical protein [Candidatus Glassbacteria bacterium]
APAEEFERVFELGQDRRRLSRTFFMAAAGMFVLNVADYFILLPRSLPGVQVQTEPEGRQRINLSLNHQF